MKILIAAIACTMLLMGLSASANSAEKYLFYMHGALVKDANDPKAKVYAAIVEDLQKTGFNVTFELRPADVGDNEPAAKAYAAKIATQIKGLIDAGTPPENITVAGFSLGSTIAAITSGLVGNAKVNFVLLAGCANKPAVPMTVDYSKMKGRILAITEDTDPGYGTCVGRLPAEGISYQEVKLNTGKGHATFRLPEYLNLWMAPLLEWTKT